MNSDTPFTTHGDEALEARIVSWVLGEASAFEAAELERLCEERPELMVFRRRMQALHGLLADAEAAQPDESWKLPPEKRKALEDIFGEEKAVRLEVEKEKRIRHSGRRALLVIAACLVLTVIVAGLLSPMAIRQRKKADVSTNRQNEISMELAASEAAVASMDQKPAAQESRGKAVVVSGQVRTPGHVPYHENMTLGEAIDSVGGATEFGTSKRVRIHRDGELSSYDVTKEEFRQVPLEPGDVVEMPQKQWLGDAGETASATPAAPRRRSASESSTLSAGKETSNGSDSIAIRELQASAEGTAPAASLKDQQDYGGGWGSGAVAGTFGRDSQVAGNHSNSKQAVTTAPRLNESAADSDAVPTNELTQRVDEVRRSLYLAEGNLNLGKVDEAKKQYQEALRIDPDNTAARRGLEKVESAKSDYYRAAYDNTRAELLKQVDDSWELSVPSDRPDENADVDPFWDTSQVAVADKRSNGTEYEIQTGYSNEYLFRGVDLDSPEDSAKPASELAGREMTRGESVVAESDKLLAAARSAYSNGDYQEAYGTYEKALNLLPDAPMLEERRDFLRKSLGDASVALSMKMEKVGRFEESTQWLYKAREWDPGNVRARQDLIADVTSEIPAAEDPYSTFSLNISDASFQVAQAALAKGEQPDPAGIKVEQFYNAVDYGDPAPSADEPVAVSIEQSAHPVIPGRNLVRIALKTAAAGRSASQPLRLTLLVDQSGSMVREDRQAAMGKALAGLSGLLTKDDLVTVIGFARTPRLLADAMAGDKAGKLADLVNQSASEGGTNLEEAIKLAEQMADRRKLAGAQNRIVLFTDGAANLGNADPAKLAEKVQQLRQKGIAFDIAGIAAADLNDELLGELARNGNGRYYIVGKGEDGDFAKQLAGAFRPAAENVKVQVRFNPERVGRYKLIGFEKDRLKTEDFRNDAVDAAELAAEEAGVAIYQVEPLPEGRGELGEVSVRFRDTASQEMVERTWTIPHDAAAPAFDRAAPSMQLAVLAMLAGEKLKGGPLADAIDFKQLAEPQANVKRFYGSSGRVAEVLRMVDALK